MKRVEVRKIGIGSAFKFFFTIGTVMGFIACLVFLVSGSLMQNIGLQLGTVHLESGSAMQVGASVVGIIVGSLVYGLINSLIGIVAAFIYNILAAMVGGIVLITGDLD